MQREKQAREDAERREKELHDRLQRFQDEAKAAQDGMGNPCCVCTIRKTQDHSKTSIDERACIHTYIRVYASASLFSVYFWEFELFNIIRYKKM